MKGLRLSRGWLGDCVVGALAASFPHHQGKAKGVKPGPVPNDQRLQLLGQLNAGIEILTTCAFSGRYWLPLMSLTPGSQTKTVAEASNPERPYDRGRRAMMVSSQMAAGFPRLGPDGGLLSQGVHAMMLEQPARDESWADFEIAQVDPLIGKNVDPDCPWQAKVVMLRLASIVCANDRDARDRGGLGIHHSSILYSYKIMFDLLCTLFGTPSARHAWSAGVELLKASPFYTLAPAQTGREETVRAGEVPRNFAANAIESECFGDRLWAYLPVGIVKNSGVPVSKETMRRLGFISASGKEEAMAVAPTAADGDAASSLYRKLENRDGIEEPSMQKHGYVCLMGPATVDIKALRKAHNGGALVYYVAGKSLRPLAAQHALTPLSQEELDKEVERLALASSPTLSQRANDMIARGEKEGVKLPAKAKELSLLGRAHAIAAELAKQERESKAQAGEDADDDVTVEQVGDRMLLTDFLPYLFTPEKVQQAQRYYDGEVLLPAP